MPGVDDQQCTKISTSRELSDAGRMQLLLSDQPTDTETRADIHPAAISVQSRPIKRETCGTQ
jgi:hypothetical protein